MEQEIVQITKLLNDYNNECYEIVVKCDNRPNLVLGECIIKQGGK